MVVTSEEIRLIEEATGIKLQYEKIRENRFKLLGETCPFLDDNNQCTIYEIRPCQCRLFHCGRLSPTDKKLDSIGEIRSLILANPEYREFKERMDAEGVAWGNHHGWNWRKM